MASELGEWVRERRLELGMTQADVTARGGPSHQTLRNIETREELPPIRPFTASRLEGVLMWEPGSIMRAIKYGERPRQRESSVEDQVTQVLRMLNRSGRVEEPSETMSFRLPKSQHEAIMARSRESGRSASDLVREAVTEYLS